MLIMGLSTPINQPHLKELNKDNKDKDSKIQIYFSSKEHYKNIQQIIVSHQNNKTNLSDKEKEYMYIQLTQQYNHERSK